MFGMDDFTIQEMSFSNSFPLEQSMTLSNVDWKDELENVIAQDEEPDTEFDEVSLYEQSWGLYFAQRSGAMGDITGAMGDITRPQFSPTSHFGTQHVTSIPQTPGKLTNSFLNGSHRATPTFLNQNHSINNEQRNQNHSNDEHKGNSACASNLLPQFEDCVLDDDGICEGSTDLKIAIESAIARRRSFSPDIVTNHSKDLSHSNNSNSQMTNDIKILKMNEIKQFHRFIQFHLNGQQVYCQNIEDINQECKRLLGRYVTILIKNTNSEYVKNSQTSWVNSNTNKCTFHLLVKQNNDRYRKNEWSQLFLDMCKSYSWIESKSNKIVFTQLTPQ